MGGWNSDSIVSHWLNYAQTMVMRMKGHRAAWLTFNEAFFYIISETQKFGVEGKVLLPPVMAGNLVSCHRAAYDMIHQLDPVSMLVLWKFSGFIADTRAEGLNSQLQLYLDSEQQFRHSNIGYSLFRFRY